MIIFLKEIMQQKEALMLINTFNAYKISFMYVSSYYIFVTNGEGHNLLCVLQNTCVCMSVCLL